MQILKSDMNMRETVLFVKPTCSEQLGVGLDWGRLPLQYHLREGPAWQRHHLLQQRTQMKGIRVPRCFACGKTKSAYAKVI